MSNRLNIRLKPALWFALVLAMAGVSVAWASAVAAPNAMHIVTEHRRRGCSRGLRRRQQG